MEIDSAWTVAPVPIAPPSEKTYFYYDTSNFEPQVQNAQPRCNRGALSHQLLLVIINRITASHCNIHPISDLLIQCPTHSGRSSQYTEIDINSSQNPLGCRHLRQTDQPTDKTRTKPLRLPAAFSKLLLSSWP